MEKIVRIGDKDVRMRASALIPRLYRAKFGRDVVTDMRQLQKSYAAVMESKIGKADKEDAQFSVLDLTIFENIAWLMCKQADPDVPDTPEEWLDGIDGMFSIYEILPQILDLWSVSQAQTSTPKKK